MSEGMHLGDRWDELRFRLPEPAGSRARIGLSLCVVLALVGGGWWMVRSQAVPVEQTLPRATRTVSASSSGGSGATGADLGAGSGSRAATGTTPESPAVTAPTAASAALVVQAAGAVVHPGVYRLGTGARVQDLVAAAGGLSPDADPDRLNLAAVLTDGSRVYVLKVGQLDEPALSSGSGATPSDGSGAPAGGSAPAATAPVNLNTASAAQLDALPGVGPATARAILDWRGQHGRFATVDQLAEVRGIGPAKLAALRAHLQV